MDSIIYSFLSEIIDIFLLKHGIKKIEFWSTYNRIKEMYYIPNLKNWINKKLLACKVCNYTQLPPPQEVIKALVTSRPRKLWQLDYIGPFPVCCITGARYGLVGVDTFSKVVFGGVIYAESWEHVLQTLHKGIDELGGKPDEIQSDNGGSFICEGYKKNNF
jgi:hypothetical protein